MSFLFRLKTDVKNYQLPLLIKGLFETTTILHDEVHV